MRIFIRILSAALVVTIPITVFCVGINIVTRMPDVYQYEFKATDSLKYLDVDENNDEMGKFISNFMIGKEKNFQLYVGEDDKQQPLFEESQMQAVAYGRRLLNITVVLGAVSLALMVAAFILMKKYELEKELRGRFRLSLLVYCVMVLVYAGVFWVSSKNGYSLWDALGYVPGEEDVLIQLITDQLLNRLCYLIPVVSTVVMLITGYILHKITEPKKIFSRNY